MLFALGAASAALNAVQSLSAVSSGIGQGSSNPFELGSPASASAKLVPASGFGGGAQISAATMNQLFHAGGSACTATPASAASSYQSAQAGLGSVAPPSVSA
jgi:hypothetical protein